jgi:hypothetical protein
MDHDDLGTAEPEPHDSDIVPTLRERHRFLFGIELGLLAEDLDLDVDSDRLAS